MKPVLSCLLIVGLLLMQSCATMFSGTTQKIKVSSDPPGAEVYVNGFSTGQRTPTELTIKRSVKPSAHNSARQNVYTFKSPGYAEGKVTDYSEINNVIWFNLLTFQFMIFTFPIDFITGAAWEFDDQIHAYLNKAEGKPDTVVQQKVIYVNAPAATAPGYVFAKNSDVDKNIPVTPNKFQNRFALIIGNEDYSSHQVDLNSEVNVAFARNDANAFREYAINVMGIPDENVIFMLDATTGKMKQGISKANKLLQYSGGQGELVVYYAGHGLPDDVTKEPYIMPVDVSGKNPTDGISLKSLYEGFEQYPSKRVTVFIDACFSGGARNQGLIAARGVKMAPKEEPLGGNLVVFSASSGEQSSLPYTQKEHGFFTYYLLKKLQETGGQVTYGDLADYVTQNVALKSVLVNEKEQNPKVSVSSQSQAVWEKWKLNE